MRPGRPEPRPRQAAASDVRVGVWRDPSAWDEFVLRARDGTVAHRWAWLDVVSGAYGHRVVPLAGVRDGALVGVLPLVHMRSRLFGHHLVSMPFLDTGGLCTDHDEAVDAALSSAAANLAADCGARLELRHACDRPIPFVPSLHKVTLVVDLSGGEDALWKRIDGNRRTQVRKARKAGLTASVNGGEALSALCQILAVNLRDLGSPLHRRGFFRRIMAAFGEDARIVLVHDGDRPVGAGLLLIHGDWIGMPWSGSLRACSSRAPSQLVYWQSLSYGIARGCRTFDYGRSTPDSGTYQYKRQWAGEPAQLFWHRLPGADAGSDVQRWQWGTRVWRRLPVPIASLAGAAVRGGIPQ